MGSIRTVGRRAAFGVSFVVVAGVAAVNSYEHMRDVALLGHQAMLLASTLPLSVDGLLVIASLAMAEDKAQHRHPRAWARVGFWFGAVISLAANIASTAYHYHDPLSIGVAAWPPIALLIVTEIMARPGKLVQSPVPVTPVAQAPGLPVPVTPEPAVAPTLAVVEQVRQVVEKSAMELPVPVSPAPAPEPSDEEMVPAGSGPRARRAARSPLTGRVISERAPKV
jgi:hypothetical protein